jgi:phage tail-like protein
MTGLPKRYLFESAAQWGAGLFAGGLLGPSGLTPISRLTETPVRIWSGDGYAPAAAASGEIYWRDGAGTLHWLSDDDPPEICGDQADAGRFGAALRIIATTRLLWTADVGARAIDAVDRRSLQPIADVTLSGTVRDLALAKRQAVAVLVAEPEGVKLVRMDERRRISAISLPPLDGAAFLVARAGSRWVVAVPTGLWWATAGVTTGSWAELPLHALGHGDGLAVALLAAFPPTGLLLVYGAAQGASQRLAILGSNGNVLDDQSVPTAVGALHGVAGMGSAVWLAGGTGLWRWDLGGAGKATFITPALRSPLGQQSGWLRAEIQADLPPGATIACQIGSTADPKRATEAQAILTDPGLADAARAAALAARIAWGPPIQVAAGHDTPGTDPATVVPTPWVVPLHTVADEYLWLKLDIAESAGGGTPSVSSLAVLYPELSLVQRLPAIYRASPSAHLRGLVALLDVQAQGLDRRIASLGKLVAAATAPDDWLNYLASWLGLPWEAGLPAETRRALLEAAPDLLAMRGTAIGIRRLIGVLLPGRPVRLSDAAALAPALLPQPGEGSAALPMVLLGRRQDATRLNAAVLGRTKLRPCGPQDDPLLRLSGWLLIEVSATESERAALAGPLARLLTGYVAAGLTPVLRWLAWPSGAGRRLDEDLNLQGPRPGVLGQSVQLGGITLDGAGPSLRAGLDLSDNRRLL